MQTRRPSPGLHYAWIILAICFVNLFISYSIRLGYGIVLPEMIRTIGLNRTQGADIFNAYLFTYLCLSPFTGYLTDRLGARIIISVFGIVLGLGAILMGTVDHVWQGVLFFGLAGVGGAAMWTPVLTVGQRWFGLKRRGMALGILSAGFGMGYAVMGRFFPVVVKHWDWRYCWYALGAAALVMVVVNGFFLRSKPEDKGLNPWGDSPTSQPGPAATALPGLRQRYAEIFSTPRFWVIGFSYFLIAGALYVTLTFLVDYARHNLGFTYERAALLASMHGIGQVIGLLTIPFMSDYIGRRRTIFVSNVMIALAILGIVLAGSSAAWLFVTIGVLGAFFGATFPMYGACGGDYFRKEYIGSVIGVWTPFYGLGAIVSNRVAGHIRDVTGAFTIPFLLAVLAALGAAALILFVKAPSERSM